MFSVHRLDASQGLRMEKLQKLSDYVKECSQSGRVVDIYRRCFFYDVVESDVGNAFFCGVCSVRLEFVAGDEGCRVGSDEMHGQLGTPNIADYFPVLKSADPQGILRETEIYFQKLFDIFDRIIDEKLKSRGPRNDLLEALIEINQRDEAEFSKNDIKHLLMDLFVGGTDTTSATTEWAMAELLRNPDKMSRVRDEITNLVGKDGQIQESDISQLPYLQAVVKETLRLHPPGPLLVPRKAEADVEMNGYIIPKNAQILVNVWACGRDSSIWPNAYSFIPERFLDQNCHQIDFRGKDFELIPFGAGRRICPGLPLAYRMVYLFLATMVHKFSWRVEEGMTEIDMNEKFGLTLQKAIPLKAIPTKL